MTSIAKPEWYRFTDIDVIVDSHKEKLSKTLKGKITALFITTRDEDEDMWKAIRQKWNETYKRDKNKRIYSLAVLTDVDKSSGKKPHRSISEHNVDKWDISTSEAITQRELCEWLDSIGIPKTFQPGVVSEEEAGCCTPCCVLDYPILLLIDPDMTIRKSLVGLRSSCCKDKGSQLDEFVGYAKKLSSKEKQPKIASPAMAGAGISADEILSFITE